MFEMKMVGPNDPLCEDPFFAYLNKHYKKGDNFSFMDAVLAYLDTLGYVVGQDRLTETQIDTLKFVHEMWHRLTPWAGTQPLSALLTPNGKFYVQGLEGRWDPTSLMFETLERANWFGEGKTNDTYFEVIENRLYAKYQQILGSRFIAFLEDAQ